MSAPNEFTDVRTVRMPDGTLREVAMTPEHWTWKEGLQILEEVTEEQFAEWALEEQGLQPSEVSFDIAYRSVIAFLAQQWEV